MPFYKSFHLKRSTPLAHMAVRGHVANWLQLLVQTAHCGWLRYINTSFLRAAELPSCCCWGGYLQKPAASSSRPETLTYDASALQVWALRWTLTSERLFGFGTRHLRICEETPDCQTPAAAFCNVQTPTQELERRWFSVSRAELLRVMFEYIRSFMLLRSSLGSDPIKRMNSGTRRVQLI